MDKDLHYKTYDDHFVHARQSKNDESPLPNFYHYVIFIKVR